MDNNKESLNKASVTGIGLLSDFHLFHYSGNSGFEVGDKVCINGKQQEFADFSKGIQLENHFKLRFSTKEDSKAFSQFPNTRNSCMQYCLNKYVIEGSVKLTDKSKTAEAMTKVHNLINNTITALRFLKNGYVASNVILFLTVKDSKTQSQLMSQRIIPAGSFKPPYDLRTNELSNLKNLFKKNNYFE